MQVWVSPKHVVTCLIVVGWDNDQHVALCLVIDTARKHEVRKDEKPVSLTLFVAQISLAKFYVISVKQEWHLEVRPEIPPPESKIVPARDVPLD